MSNFKKELNELLTDIDQSQIKKLGYVSISYMNEAREHSLWKPRLILKNEEGLEIIIDGEKKIIEKLKEIYNKTRIL